jgi:hypothetical protein
MLYSHNSRCPQEVRLLLWWLLLLDKETGNCMIVAGGGKHIQGAGEEGGQYF